MILRIVKSKYVETGVFRSYQDGLQHFFRRVVPLYPLNSWQDFRETDLWTVEVNDLYLANFDSLRKLYRAIICTMKHPRQHPNYRDSTKFLTGKHPLSGRKSEIGEPSEQNANRFLLSEKQARYCYAMSKMTVAVEVNDAIRSYDQLQFVEFLELLGRVARIQFEQSPLQHDPFIQRLEYTLDTALAHISLERRETNEL